MNPKYPVYIISKGRADSRLTVKALERMDVPYHIVVEEQEYDDYARVIESGQILVLPQRFRDEYDTCTAEPTEQKGSGPARNYCWEHSISNGASSHWILDDNIRSFRRINRNGRYRFSSGTGFKIAEDFVDRYENVAISGFNYVMFLPARTLNAFPPLVMNTRIFSTLLIRNNLPYRWRAKYNEDVDLSLRVLKSGRCTVRFNAFAQEKMATLAMKGGNTDSIYTQGTYEKSKMIVALHPDVARMAWKYGRWHHYVDYRPFKHNQLIKKQDIEIVSGVNNYGLVMSRRR